MVQPFHGDTAIFITPGYRFRAVDVLMTNFHLPKSTLFMLVSAFAGLAIGLTLAVIHIVGIQVTGVSVNPARSFGPAVLVGGEALAQLWLFIIAPLAGAALGALLFRSGVLETRA